MDVTLGLLLTMFDSKGWPMTLRHLVHKHMGHMQLLARAGKRPLGFA